MGRGVRRQASWEVTYRCSAYQEDGVGEANQARPAPLRPMFVAREAARMLQRGKSA
jgi:hypothetical protein